MGRDAWNGINEQTSAAVYFTPLPLRNASSSFAKKAKPAATAANLFRCVVGSREYGSPFGGWARACVGDS
jgi:hypothetical protein